MSDSYGTGVPSPAENTTGGASGILETPESTDWNGTAGNGQSDSAGTMETAKREAAGLKDTAAEQAKDVAGTAKDEASSVISDVKWQAKDLYAQTQRELKDQANTQQQRVAAGLRSVGQDLDSMAAGSQQQGLATDLVRQVSGRVSSAASWLGERDPGAVLTEVKRFARRRPGTFILAAAITGIVVGRLTRALASNASDESNAATPRVPAQPDAWTPASTAGNGSAASLEETPIYAQTSPAWVDDSLREDADDRSDTV